ncbi:hypothetical protein G6F57_002504 [Rhizopus arrhizus]|uniref:DMAP1-binding domain-containing protein n=1 Tax=Rhizopus oryzae TaxID=64495 RepID=A0A9P6XEI9_RHIOR|nr:hypothetical protein G6F23_002845 [Rhizopus arrhizus]KAG1424446.1 hypothetical protein G6F58_002367 [Rhizopus delemar]KAG0761274.1 hypothetical protein G6F24_007695 [Rhizopus arrhizus]KAG0909186.1 hypothetical protein G6F33_009017 [Rhizopus arrhizus]KAG0939306.1 hypothetical protein G6F30_007318 [Rhizopus arrhizus]
MQAEHIEDLPADILNKLRNLDLELADGDITQKGYDKKKANLLASIATTTTTTTTTTTAEEEESFEDLGPEPSAADVVDFLDFLPSPTHSPRESEGASLMESNHLRLQQEQQQQQQQQQQAIMYQNGSPNMRPMQAPPQYRPYRPLPTPNNPPYYNNSPSMGSPLPNNRPYMVVRNNGGYQQPPAPSQPPQPQQQRPPGANPYMYPNNRLPPQNVYRPANTSVYQRPMIYNNTNPRPSNLPPPQQQNIRPIYRPTPPRPPFQNYRPQPQASQQYVPGRSPEMQYGNVRPNYPYAGANRSPSSTHASITGRYDYADHQSVYSARE